MARLNRINLVRRLKAEPRGPAAGRFRPRLLIPVAAIVLAAVVGQLVLALAIERPLAARAAALEAAVQDPQAQAQYAQDLADSARADSLTARHQRIEAVYWHRQGLAVLNTALLEHVYSAAGASGVAIEGMAYSKEAQTLGLSCLGGDIHVAADFAAALGRLDTVVSAVHDGYQADGTGGFRFTVTCTLEGGEGI